MPKASLINRFPPSYIFYPWVLETRHKIIWIQIISMQSQIEAHITETYYVWLCILFSFFWRIVASAQSSTSPNVMHVFCINTFIQKCGKSNLR